MGLGNAFETEIQNYFRSFEDGTDYKSFKVVMSGAVTGSTSFDPNLDLEGDVIVNLPFIPGLKVECKHYKSETKDISFRIQKSWFDKILKEAENANRLGMMAIKFKNYDKNSVQFIMSLKHFTKLLNHFKELYNNKEKPNLSLLSKEELFEELRLRLNI